MTEDSTTDVPRLTTPRLVLEPVSAEQARAIRDGRLDGLQVGAGWPHDDTLDGLLGVAEEQSFGWLVLLDGVVIGDCGVHGRPDGAGEVEIGYGLAAPARGAGYGTELVAALASYLGSRPDVRRIVAGTDPANVPSRLVLERAGFAETGVDGGEVRFALDAP